MTHKKSKETREVNVAENVLSLEKLIKKLIRKGFRDSTLDYTVQISVSSLEPGKVKYGFMVNGLKKEIQPIAMSFYTYKDCVAVLEGMIQEINTVEVEKNFHQGRINVYKNAITNHEERLKYLEEHPDEVEKDSEIEMEEV